MTNKHIYQDTREQVRARDAARPPKPKKPELEADIQRKIKAWLDRLGAVPLRINSGHIALDNGKHVALAPPGTSDLIAALPVITAAGMVAVFCAIEVKRPGNKPTGIQQKFIDKINGLGGIAFYAVSVDDAKQKLNERLRERFGVSNEYDRS